MKKITLTLAAALAACSLSACEIDVQSSLKELSDPYIATYECVRADYGGQDMLEKYDYIRITLTDKETMLLSYKEKGGKAHSRECGYSYDEKTGELTAEIGLLGVSRRESVVVENGQFTLSMPIAGTQLIMQFKS